MRERKEEARFQPTFPLAHIRLAKRGGAGEVKGVEFLQGWSCRKKPMIEPNFNAPVQPIAELVVQPDFPRSAIGAHVDIGGYTGVVVDVVNVSLRVRTPDGVTKGFNANNLKRIYGPVEKPEIPETIYPPPPPPRSSSREPALRSPPPPRQLITEPNFDAEVKDISTLVHKIDFPRCAFGQHVQIADYTGVVVEIVGESLKVRSKEDVTRSYNAPVLRRLYGQKPGGGGQ